MSDKINHRAPASSSETSITEPMKSAVGMKAVLESFKQMNRYMDMPKALKASLKINQKGGFDCPGCAWPDPEDDRSPIAEYCENGIKAMVEEATKNLADVDFFQKNSVSELSDLSDFEIGKSGRIAQPMYLSENGTHYEPITWNNAFKKIAGKLHSLNSPHDAIFYTSGRTSNEAAFMYGAFVRMYGTNNLPDCSNMCHESSGAALSKTVGIGKGSVTLSDLHEADLILIMGQNPGTNHPRMLNALEKNKENGGTIISVNPLKEAGLMHYTNPQRVRRILGRGISLSDMYLQVKINGDLALMKAVIYKLWQKEEQGEKIFDKAFISEYCDGYDAFLEHVKTTDLQRCITETGLQESQIDALTQSIIENEKIIICWAMGLTQHENAVATIQELVNLLLLKGSIGKPGAGTCPVRGHSNVQGDRTMGIWEKMSDDFHEKLGKAFSFESPTEHGYDTVESIKAMSQGKVKVFFAMGGNFLSAAPDTDLTAEGLRKCDLTVHVSTKLNRSHLVHGKEALILPCKGRTEMDMQKSGYQFVSVENSMGQVHSSKGVLEPVSKLLKSEVEIVTGLAKATFGEETKVDWESYANDYDRIRDKIQEVVSGFEDYNNKIRNDIGFYLPNSARDRTFTQSGKAIFTCNSMISKDLSENKYALMTIRSHDQYNTTIYGLDDRYRGIKNGRKVVLMNMQDMTAAGLSEMDTVDITSHFNGIERTVYKFKVIPYDIPPACLGAYFPEANPLVSIDHVAKESNTPVSKYIKVSLKKTHNSH